MKSMLSKAAWLRVIPFVLFMVMLAIRGNWPAGAQAVLDAKWVYGLGVLLVGGALYVLWPQYQELARDQRKLGWLGWLLSITVGVVVFVLWITGGRGTGVAVGAAPTVTFCCRLTWTGPLKAVST